MNIIEYAKVRTTSKRFVKWLEEEPQVMVDWAMDTDGKSVEYRYNYFIEIFESENKCSK